MNRTMRERRPPRRIVKTLLAAAGGVAATGLAVLASYPHWRDRCLTWGATKAEVIGPIPGDELLTQADIVSTRAIGIEAPPEAIWPWLAQMGSGRGGVYT